MSSSIKNFKTNQQVRRMQGRLNEERYARAGFLRIKDFVLVLDERERIENFLDRLDLLLIEFASPTTNENWQYSFRIETVGKHFGEFTKRRS